MSHHSQAGQVRRVAAEANGKMLAVNGAAVSASVVRRDDRREKTMKPIARLATLFLALVALAQFIRLVLQIEVVAGGVHIPLWASAVACVVTGGLAILLWRESKR